MFGPSKLTRALAIGLLTAGLLGGAACSSDGSEGGSDKTTTTGKATSGGSTTTTTGADSETSEPDDIGPSDPGAEDPGAEGPSDEVQDYIDQFAKSISADGFASLDQGTCMAEAWVDLIGFEAITDTGMSPSQFGDLDTEGYQKLDLGDTEAGALYDTFDTCGIDVVKAIRESGSTGATPEQRACIDEVLTEDSVRFLFEQGILRNNEEAATILDQTQACFAE